MRSRSPETASRSGLISVAVLIALMIVAILCAAMLKVGFARRLQVKAWERRVQADWLLESGIDRAACRLETSPDYRGETWTIPTEQLGNRGAGSVLIKVEPVLEKPASRRVEVIAEYPTGSVQRSRRSQILVIEAPNPPR